MKAQTDAAETLEPLLSIRETEWLPALLVKGFSARREVTCSKRAPCRTSALTWFEGIWEDGLELDSELSLTLDTLDKIQRYAKPAHN